MTLFLYNKIIPFPMNYLAEKSSPITPCHHRSVKIFICYFHYLSLVGHYISGENPRHASACIINQANPRQYRLVTHLADVVITWTRNDPIASYRNSHNSNSDMVEDRQHTRQLCPIMTQLCNCAVFPLFRESCKRISSFRRSPLCSLENHIKIGYAGEALCTHGDKISEINSLLGKFVNGNISQTLVENIIPHI